MKKQLLLIGLILAQISTLNAQENNQLQKIKNAFQSENFRLSGYGQIVYSLTEHPIGENPNNSIDVSRVILFAAGKLGNKNQFGYMLMYDFGPNAKLHELYGEWTPMQSVNLRIGQYKIPFTLENPMSPARIETIQFSRSASAMCGSAGDVNQFDRNGIVVPKVGRDVGVQLSGCLFLKNDFYQLEYYAGLFNGSGFDVKDNDNHKDFIGTAYWQPIKGLRMGGSIYSGKFDNHTRDRWAAGAEYNSK
ncbi:MAG: OprO/OprP family phosphate-selective porin, partial [Dysgonamonadaceae bacterium]|nr:OprO/OprP family phosphate-selective porin [Dysgonamonadaceae bacterium]